METMTQEDKELLLKDLCARLPFKVKVEAKGLLKVIADDYDNRDIINAHVLNGLNLRDYFKTYSIDSIEKVPLFNRKGVCNIKPYLFPLSSMTEEQWKEITDIQIKESLKSIDSNNDCISNPLFSTEDLNTLYWCYANHIDIHNLIGKGLAINATGLNIY